jgi:hypothetical protein
MEQFCNSYVSPIGSKSFKDNILDAEYWNELEQLHGTLEDFYETTVKTEGNYITLLQYFAGCGWLMAWTEEQQDEFLR